MARGKETLKVYINPPVSPVDTGDGGVGRVERMQFDNMNPGTSLNKKWTFVAVDNPADADVIACHIMIPPEYINLYPNKAFVAHCHGLYWAEYEWSRWAYAANKDVSEALRLADVVTVPSEWVANVVRREYMRDPYIIPHGVDPKDWPISPVATRNGKPYVFFDKTRVDPVCETDSLLAVARLLPNIQFVTTAPLADPNPPMNIEYIGKQDFATARELMLGAACYLATTKETFGMSIIQALCAGIPIAGYYHGGLKEIRDQNPEPIHADWQIKTCDPGNIETLAKIIQVQFGRRFGSSIGERYSVLSAMDGYHATWMHAFQTRNKIPSNVHIVVTAYNLEKYLPTAIESVINQTYKHWNCTVFVDDSPDNCATIAESYAENDPRITVINSSENLYLAGARNAAIARRTADEYTLCLDADDSLTPNALKMLVEFLDKRRDIDIAYSGLEFKELDGRVWRSGWPVDWDLTKILDGKNVQPYCSMYRTRVWRTIGGYRRRYRTQEDADFWARAALAGFRSEKVSDEPMLTYLIRSDSMSQTNKKVDYLSWLPRRLPAGSPSAGMLPVPSLDPAVIGVVIPVGNGHEKYLYDALDSLYAQDFPYWRCVVVNDTDNPLDFLPYWAKVIQGPKTGNVADARNVGIAFLAEDVKFILPLDADDYLQNNALSSLMKAAAETNYESIVYSDWWEDSQIRGTFQHYKTADFDCRYLIEHGPIYSATCLFPVKYWQKVNGYPSYNGWEDWGIQLRFAAAGFPARRIALPLFTYRKHTGLRANKAMENFAQSRDEILRDFADYFEGKKQLMACGCGKSLTQTSNASSANVKSASLPQDGATLVSYSGAKIAGFSIIGSTSGRKYRFKNGESSYVLNQDLEQLLRLPGFSRLENIIPKAPALVAG